MLTWTGASGAPRTPRRSRRSELLYGDEDTDGALQSCPFIHWPHRPSIFESPPSVPSGPSFNGESASAGLRLPDLEINGSGCATWRPPPPFLRRRRLFIGEPLLAGLFGLDLPGESPLTTSSLMAVKKPCFLSIITTMPLQMRVSVLLSECNGNSKGIIHSEKRVKRGERGEKKRSGFLGFEASLGYVPLKKWEYIAARDTPSL